MMKSAAKLAYSQAQAAIDGAPDDKTSPILDSILKPLWNAYAVLKRGRDAREPLELDLPEKKILLTPDGKVDKVIVPERLDAHKLIEEFMIQANVAAAETLEARRQPLIFRIHDAPALAKQETLREFLRTLDLSLAKGAELQPAQFNRILEAVEGSDHQELVNQVVLRTQSQAEYNPDNIGHFGLHLRRYAHFTSPIRRYADLIVHRALIKALNLGNDGLTADEEAHLEEISALISSTERRAMLAERETVDRLIAHFLAAHLGDEYEGRVTGVTRAGLFVNLATYGADGLVPISTLGHEYYLYDEANHAIAGERSGKGFRLGDTVTVRLVEALPVAGALRFEMVSEPHPLPMATRSHHKASRTMRGRRVNPRASRVRREEVADEHARGQFRAEYTGFRRESPKAAHPKRPLGEAMWRGFRGRCPHCGEGKLFRAFVKPVAQCSVCDEDYTEQRADDLPAYLTILIVGHVVVGAFMGVEATTNLPLWAHMAIWGP